MDNGAVKRKRRWPATFTRVALGLILLLLIAAGLSAAFNILATRHYRALYPPPGRLYQVDGHTMHLYCTGEGSPTIVLDAGLGDDFLIWGKVQPELSRSTRVCSYDRAGFGWSEAQPGPRDADTISTQLHALLQQAGITGPIVLMGHSIAGMYIRSYAALYPRQVVGLVFVDGSTPLQDDHFPAAWKSFDSNRFALLRVASALGVPRLLGQCTKVPAGLEAYAGWMKADSCAPAKATAIGREFSAMRQSGEETVHTGPFGDMPVLIFSQDPNKTLPPQIPPDMARQFPGIWNGMQQDLKLLSTHSRRIIAKGSSHYIQIERADLLNREVPIFIQQIRGNSSQPTDYGSTTTE